MIKIYIQDNWMERGRARGEKTYGEILTDRKGGARRRGRWEARNRQTWEEEETDMEKGKGYEGHEMQGGL